MNQLILIYNPAFDLYHGIYRMLLLLQYIKGDSIEVDKLRVWDYYFLFPSEVARTITFPNELKDLRKVFKVKTNPYENILDSKRTLKRLEGYQFAALKCLAASGYIDPDELSKNIVMKTKKEVPPELLQEFENLTDKEKNVIKLLLSPFNDLGLYGETGFKFRTGLLEFKYDAK